MTSANEPPFSEHTMTLPDGTGLFYRAWEPEEPAERALVLFHRGHEHSGRFRDVVAKLDLRRTAIYAWDARGHGQSPGPRGYAPNFATTAHDMDCFVRGLSEQHGISIQQMVILGHSVGAVGVAAWVHDYAPPIRGLILVTPAFRVRLYLPLAIPGLRVIQKLRGERKTFIKSYVKSKMLTHDREQAQQYDNDPLISRSIAVNILLDLHDTATRLIDDAPAIQTPTLLLSAGSDWVVTTQAQRRFLERLDSSRKAIRTFSGMYHDLLHEKDREPVLQEIRAFLADCADGRRLRPYADDADRYGYTALEYDRLCQPLGWLSPKRMALAVQWLTLQTLGRLSDGIQLGWRTGFDSGQSLDYIYANQPAGRLGPLGRWIDRQYLNAPGWRGIRARREHLQQMLRDAIKQSGVTGRPVRILDVAAGSGRYVLTVASEFDGSDLAILLRDHQRTNLDEAKQLADQFGLENVSFQEGDALDEKSVAAVEPAPDIAIVSGLYELTPRNAPVLASLRGLTQALPPGGQLLYTGQPWHPQLEMIARVLPNREGRPWIMRRRTQHELDSLVQTSGFIKQEQTIDANGIFTVNRAVRPTA